jgi:acyl-CoA-binding protein
MDVTTYDDDVERVFEGAVVFVQATLPQQASSVSQPLALKLYGLYKQATVGDIKSAGLGLFSLDLKAKSKWCGSYIGEHG